MIKPVTQLVLTEAFEPALDAARAYELYGRFLWQTLYRLGIRQNDLPDALQDVLVVVHRRGHDFEPGARATTWLYAICRRVAAARRRKAYARRETPDGDIEIVDPNDPERIASTHRAKQRLERVLDDLNDDQRIVFVMFEVEGLSCPEIADELVVPVGTVYSRLHAARQSFQKSLARLKGIEHKDQLRNLRQARRRGNGLNQGQGEP
jgi:RNA polymerase sigma-70 factor (ECF subfamily)